MILSIGRLAAWALLACAVLFSAGARAQSFDLTHTVKAELAGVPLNFPLDATLTPKLGAPVDFSLRADISELVTKIDPVIVASGLGQPPGTDGSFTYKGTILSVDGERLWAKYHFRADLGLETNGSVELFFRPVIVDNALRLTAEDPKLNISNDLVKGAARLLKLDEALAGKLTGAVNGFLSSPEAALQLPPELVAAEAELISTRFDRIGDKQVVVVVGKLQLTMALLQQLVASLGS